MKNLIERLENADLEEAKKRTFYFGGDKVQYTGKTEKIYGGKFYEFVYLEGRKKGQKGYTPHAPTDPHPGIGGQREEDVELDEADLSGARSYVRRMKHKGKKEYAGAYLKWLSGGKRGEEPDYHDYGLSVMGKQAVHMGLEGFGFSYFDEDVELTEESIGRRVLEGLLPMKDVRKIGRASDEQTAKLALEVYYGLIERVSNALGPGGEEALNRLANMRRFATGGKDTTGIIRNNVFKAANSLKMKLPSMMF